MGMRDVGAIWGMSPRQIYEELTGGPGSKSLNDAQMYTQFESAEESKRAAFVRDIGAGLEAGWQGGAGEGAFGATKPLVRASYEGSDLLHMGQDLLSRQSESFETAKNSVEPVGDQPEMDLTDFVNGDIGARVVEFQEASQKNVQVFAGYDNASTYNEEHAPIDYAPPSGTGQGIDERSAGGMIDSDDYRQDGDGGPGDSSGGPGSGGPGSGAPYGGGPSSGSVPGGAPGGSTSTAGYDPGPRPVPGPYPGVPGPSHSPTSTPPGTGPYAAPLGGVPGGGGTGGGPGGGGGTGGRGPGGGAPGRGPLGGPGAGALAAEEAAARRGGVGATGAGGRGAGAMGGAPMGGRGGKGDEETEHQRKYLIGPDPDATFDTDVLVAPPVIGDDDEDY